MLDKNLSIGDSPPTMPGLNSNDSTHKLKCEGVLDAFFNPRKMNLYNIQKLMTGIVEIHAIILMSDIN